MLAAGLITFREGLEAALIVGIVLGYLRKVERLNRQRWVWAGVVTAVVASFAVALGLQLLGGKLEGRAEQIFEGTTMFLAVVVLTWMIFWMRYQARFIKVTLERRVRTVVTAGQNWGLWSLVFIAVFREGVETALFLTAATFVANPGEMLWGGLLGLAMAVMAGWILYTTTVRLDVRRFFDVTSLILLFFAAGLMAHGIHEFQEAGLLPTLVEHLWSTKAILNDKSLLGSLLRSLVGYNDDPSLLEVVAYWGYWAVVVTGVRWWTRRLAMVPSQEPVG